MTEISAMSTNNSPTIRVKSPMNLPKASFLNSSVDMNSSQYMQLKQITG